MKISMHDHAEDQNPEEIRESAYRRGFQQGVVMAMEAVESGTPEPIIRKWTEKIGLWRYRIGCYAGSRSSITKPPVIAKDPTTGHRRLIADLRKTAAARDIMT